MVAKLPIALDVGGSVAVVAFVAMDDIVEDVAEAWESHKPSSIILIAH